MALLAGVWHGAAVSPRLCFSPIQAAYVAGFIDGYGLSESDMYDT